ncbi:MAG: molybdopterin-dependent oxidoreductase [Halioglobus sp.]
MSEKQYHYRTCHLCETMCGIEVEHDGEQILAIRGDKNDVLSKGNICPKATGLQDIHNCPDRLRKPIRRVRKNPDQKSHEDEWVEIEWEDALEYASTELARIQNTYGKDSVASYAGRSTAHNMGVLLATQPTRDIIGSRNIYTGSTVDQMPHNFVWYHMFGHQFLCTIPDINRTDYYLMLGTNPKISNGAQMATGANTYKKLNALRERGGKSVLLDPRRTESVKYVDEHFFIKPHTDSLFLIGVIKTIFDKGLCKMGRMEGHTKGLSAVEEAIKAFELTDISRVTGIPATDIERIAVEFATAKTAVCYGRTGISMVDFAGVTQWLMQVLNVITGNMDEIGGMTFPKPAIDSLELSRSSWDRYRSRVSGRPEFSDEFPLIVLGEEILTPGEGQIKALLGFAGNMVLSMADGNNSEKALNALEFYVAVDLYRNETTRFADVILPPCGPFEKSHYDFFYHLYDTINWAKFSPKLFDTPESQWSDWEIFTELLGRFATKREKNPVKKALINLAHRFVRRFITPELVTDLGLRFGAYGSKLNPFSSKDLSLKKLKQNPHGIYLGEHGYTFPDRLWTQDKKIDLAPSVIVADLARLKMTHLDAPNSASEFDLKIISRLTNRTLGWMHHSYRLVKGKNPCELMLHPKDADARGISTGDSVRVSSRVGQIELPVMITEDIMPGVVCMPHLWGHGRKNTQQTVANNQAGVSMNDLTDVEYFDQLTGNAIVNGVPVKVELVAEKAKIQREHEDEVIEEYIA